MSCQRNDSAEIKQAVINQLNTYPKSTLQDVYKYFYQEHFGPEHAISDTAAVKKYLMDELHTVKGGKVYYEPIGVHGDYVRVYLNAVTDGLITAEDLSNAFIASANTHRTPSADWVRKWENIVRVIQTENIEIQGLDDIPMLEEAAKQNQAVHHSQAYNEAYHPHYRIVSKEIFEQKLSLCRNAASRQAE